MSSADRGSVVSLGDANILMLQKRRAVIHCLSSTTVNGNVHANTFGGKSNLIHKHANLYASQTFDSTKDALAIDGVTYSINGDVTIERYNTNADRANAIILTQGQGKLELDGYNIPLERAGNILVSFGSTEGFVTLSVSKGDAFVDPDTQQLEARQRGDF